jgi:hypothetical protein
VRAPVRLAALAMVVAFAGCGSAPAPVPPSGSQPLAAESHAPSGGAKEGAITITFSGAIDVQIADDLSGTYRATVHATTSAAPGIWGKIDFVGNGHARLALDLMQLELLDGRMSAKYLGLTPTLGISGALAPTSSGASAVPVLAFACGAS